MDITWSGGEPLAGRMGLGGRQAAGHADFVQASIARSDAAHSAVVASWRRSLQQHRLDPAEHKAPRRLTESELKGARLRMEQMIRAAEGSLDRLYLAVGGVGCCVMLADRDGILVERRGAVADNETFDEWGLWTGTVWSEGSEGTNGIGTCIADQRALTIHRDQHFLSRNTLLSCTTAPVYDHEGNLIAALDVSSCRSDLTEGFVQLIAVAVGDAARRIEAENFRMVFSGARILLAPVGERSASALIAVDADDLVIGATRSARLALGLTRDALSKGLLAADVLGDATRVAGDLEDAERGALQRALARSGGNVSAAAQCLGISRATLHRKLARLGIRRPH
jgi:transcriptional regulator of acetoin/glycerol metabolism